LQKGIDESKVIVTYNGKSFDIPFVESFFNIRLNHAQIDLRYVPYSLGFRGGLKGCEKQLGMDRGDLSDIDGFFAVLLWQEYQYPFIFIFIGHIQAAASFIAYHSYPKLEKLSPFVFAIFLILVLFMLALFHLSRWIRFYMICMINIWPIGIELQTH
jgi:hypothetical protein